MSSAPVSAPLRQIPNALTLARFAAIPIFIALLVQDQDGPSWPAGIVFGLAAITDQLDGYLARRWHVESAFGKIADPLADRLMIDSAAILLALEGKLPWAGAAIIVLRDALLVAGYRLLMPRGYELNVTMLGKIATWLLYLSVGILTVTGHATDWPLWIFWTGLVLGLLAFGEYALKARLEVLA